MNEIKEFEKICDSLESEASRQYTAKVKEAQAYYEGYKQACEDYFEQVKYLIRPPLPVPRC